VQEQYGRIFPVTGFAVKNIDALNRHRSVENLPAHNQNFSS